VIRALVSRLWSRLTYANVLATIAVFISLGGSSYAVLRITGKNVPRNALTGADITGLTTRDIRDRSLLRRDFKKGQLLRGRRGRRGLQGVKGDKGDQGVPGPLLDTLPSGKTEVGKYYALDSPAPSGQFAVDVVSYQFPLPSTPIDRYLAPGAAPTAECPGSVDNPKAVPGHLCVYSQKRAGVQTSFSGDGMGFDALDRYGFAVNVVSSGTAGNFYDYGSWAVTAP
jgi:hypothetical protein